MNTKIFKTKNIYMASFLVSQEGVKLGKVYIEDIKRDNKAIVEIEYNEDMQPVIDNYIEVYNNKKAICRLSVYQDNIRFIMHLVNLRKSGISEATNGK